MFVSANKKQDDTDRDMSIHPKFWHSLGKGHVYKI